MMLKTELVRGTWKTKVVPGEFRLRDKQMLWVQIETD